VPVDGNGNVWILGDGMGRRTRTTAGALALFALVLGGCERWTSNLVSVDESGADSGNEISLDPVFSPDGTKIAFRSRASDLGPTDTTLCRSTFQPVVIRPCDDIYLRDLTTGTTTLVSTNAAGTDSANQDSIDPVFSPDGTKLAFVSRASDLVTSPTVEGGWNIYFHDLESGTNTLATTNAAGDGPGFGTTPVFNADGTKLVFTSSGSDYGFTDTNFSDDIYLKDLETGAYTQVSINRTGTDAANGFSHTPLITPDGTKVVFTSQGDDFGPRDFFASQDVYLRDLTRNRTFLVSADAARTNSGNGGSGGAAISPDGTKVVFGSSASNLGVPDTNGLPDLYIRDIDDGGTWRLPVERPSNPPEPTGGSGAVFSPDGTKLAFVSWAEIDIPGAGSNGLADVFVYDLAEERFSAVTGTDRVGEAANGGSFDPVWSPDGTKLAYWSLATNMTTGTDTNGVRDVYLTDFAAHETVIVSGRRDGKDSADGESYEPIYNPNAAADQIAFLSTAANLQGSTAADTNGRVDVYLAEVTDPEREGTN
jgi:Tol biopolymer transport system component